MEAQTKVTPIKVLFHSISEGMHCDDGFGAAWAAKKFYEKIGILDAVEFIPVRYGQLPPIEKIDGNNVLIVDFSYKREQIESIKRMAHSLVVLDHHKTAEKELEGIEDCIFDMNRSGAMMTWQYLMPNELVPALIKIVQDNDVWRHQIPHCQELVRWIRSYPQTFQAWDDINTLLTINYDRCLLEAESIERYYRNQLEAQMGLAIPISIGKQYGAIINVAKQYASDAGHALSEQSGNSFGISYFIRRDGKAEISIRSNTIDVSEIAKQFGGGGHKAAAGWAFNADELMMYIARNYI